MSPSARDGGAPGSPSVAGGRPSTARAAGWAVRVSVLGLVLAWTFGILFLTSGGLYGPLSDLGSILYNLPLVVVAWVLYRLYRPAAPAVSAAVVALGLVGAAVSVGSGVGLTATDLGVPTGAGGVFLTGQRVGGIVTGIWLIGVSAQELSQAVLARRIALAGLLAGSGLVLLDVSLLVGGEGHPGFGLGSILQLLGAVLWSVWLARRLLDRDGGVPTEPSRESADAN